MNKEKKENFYCSKILLVEGLGDKSFFEKFLSHLNLKEISVIKIKGKTENLFKASIENVFDNINTQGKKLESLIFIRDSDNDDIKNYFKDIKKIFEEEFKKIFEDYNYKFSEKPNEISNYNNLKTGIFFINSNLEDLCLKSIEDKKLLENINNFIENNSDKTGWKDKSKKYLATYLATKEKIKFAYEPGSATQREIINFDSLVFEELKDFLIQAFQ